MASHLSFLKIDLNGANNMNFDDLKWPKSESFHITQEMLDSCDINESITFNSISMPVSKTNIEPQSPKILAETRTEPRNQNEPKHSTKNAAESNEKLKTTKKDETNTTCTANSNAEHRCEDEIFGEFVVAMLKKLPLEEKKRAKKEIINVLL